ncbi:hypothetical protein [Pontibacter rugosus]
MVSTLVVNHTAQQAALKDIKESEAKIFVVQQAIASKMVQIKELEEKMYNSLKSVQSIIGQSKNIVYASRIAQDIGTYQGQMMDIAQETRSCCSSPPKRSWSSSTAPPTCSPTSTRWPWWART